MIVERATATHGKQGIVAALNREWAELVSARPAGVSRWASSYAALAGCADLADVLWAVRRLPDDALAALLTEVAGGDELAGRAVLQIMLGRIVRMAVRDPYAGVDDYVGALWLRIRSYPLDNRPRKISANLSMDTFKSVWSERCAQRQPEVTPWPPEVFLDDLFERDEGVLRLDRARALSVDGARVLALGRCLNVLDEQTYRLLWAVYVDGLSGPEAAALLGSSSGSVRVRCSKAVRRLAERSADLLAAA